MRTALKKYAVFSGRAPRGEYLGFVAGCWALAFALQFLGEAAALIVLLVSKVLLAVPTLAVTVRRLHDRNLSGWWIFSPMIVVFFFGLLAGISGMATPDRSPPQDAAFVAVGVLANLAFLVNLAFVRGTKGANRFGPDPLADARRPALSRPLA